MKNAALVSSIAIAVLAAGCEGRARQGGSEEPVVKGAAESGAGLVEIDLSHGAAELPAAGLFGTSSARSTYSDLARTLDELAKDDEVKGVFVKIGGASFGMARAEEIGDLLGAVRKRGLPIVCHADGYGNATMLAAAKGCSEIWLTPSGEVESVGIAAQLIFGNKLLTKLHVGVDYLQIGKFKGAEEPFTRDAPSPEARASLEGTLRGVRAAWVDGIVKGRDKKELEAEVEDGPFTADEALAKGFVDKIGYVDDARDAAKKAAGTDVISERYGGGGGGAPRGIAAILRALTGGGERSSSGAHVAIVPAVGAITMASASSLPWNNSEGITEHELGRVIQRLTRDSSVSAVVLRIDSPGGSALASDLLWKRLMKLREKKPLVVSVGGMAASGGYYLSCTANKIVAEPESIVGSIGVVGGKLSIGTALDEIGIHAETIAASPDPAKASRAAYSSLFTPWDDATRERMRASMQSIYDLFLKRVAEGRGTTVDKIAPSAEGRIFGGVEAKERGLVDELGGVEDAIRIARELAKLPDDAPAEVVSESSGLFDLVEGGKAGDEDAERAAADRMKRFIGADPIATWAAARPEIGALIGSMAPLVEGEHTLTALPFALVIQ